MRATSFCQRHFDYGHSRLVRRSEGVLLLREIPRMHGAFHDAPRTSDDSVRAFRGGRFLPATSTELSSSDAPVTALRLALLRIALARRLSPGGGDPPLVRGGVCERAAKITRLRRPPVKGMPQVLMIQSAFHRTGDHSRLGSCPPLRFASAAPPRSPGAARFHDDDAVRTTSATTIRS